MQADMLPASVPHERMMVNLAVFHMLIPIIALASGIVIPLLSLALVGSLISIAWIGWYARYHHFANEHQRMHWQLAWRHCRWLLYAYGVSALIMVLGAGISHVQADHNMASIILVIFSRLAVVPTLLMVLLLFVVETGALSDSRKS